jgi:hypothetical protein
MLLGYIVSEEKIKLDNFIVVNSIPQDSELPKLIVGLDFIKRSNIKVSILNKNVSKNCFWTYSSKEKKSDYLEDLENFKNYCLNNFLKDIVYYYIDPFSLKFSQIKKIINKVKKNGIKLFYSDEKMCYIFVDKVTLGLNWEVLNYFNIEKNKILNYIEKNNFCHLPNDEIFNECMVESNKHNDKKIIPYLYYLKKYGEQNIISDIHR